MSIFSKFIDLFNPYTEEDMEKSDIKQYRMYCVLGFFFTIIITVAIRDKQKLYNEVIQYFIALAFVVIGILTFRETTKKSISTIIFWLILFITLYALHNTYVHGFSVDQTFGLLVLFFVFSLLLKNKKEILAFYSVVGVLSVIEIAISPHTGISKSYLMGFFTLFAALGYVVMLGKMRIVEKLQEKEVFHKTLFNKAFDSIMLVDYFSREVVDCNDVAVRMFEVEDKNEIIGFSREKFMKKEMSEAELVLCRKEFMSKGIWRSEAECRSKKGREFWVDITITPLNLKSGQYYVTRMTDITFKKMTEKVIIESEMKYRSLVENMGEGILMSDLNGNATFVNDRFCEMVEYEKKELIGKKDTDVISFTDESKKTIEENIELRKQGGYSKYEIEIKTSSGRWIWAEVSGAPVFNNEGEIIGSMGIFTDITERKRAATTIRESEEKYRALFENNLAGVFRTNIEGVILECNDSYAKIYGFDSREEIIGKSCYDFYFVSSDRDEYLKTLMKAGKLTNNELRNKKNSGEEIWVLENVKLTGEGEGNSFVEGTVIEITEFKKATEALRQSEEKMSLVLSSIDSMVYNVSFDKEGKRTLEYISPMVKQLFGYTKEQYDNQEIDLLKQYHPEDMPMLMFELQKMKKKKTPITIRYRFRHFETGKYNWIEESIFPKFDNAGEHVANFGIARNIDDIIKYEKSIQDSEERYRQMFEKNPLPMWIYSKDTLAFIDVNEEAVKHYGYSRKEFLKMNIMDIRPKEETERLRRWIEENESKKKLKTVGNWKHRKKDGSLIDVEVTRSRITLKGRALNVALVKDITQQKHMQEQLLASEERFRILSEATFEGVLFSVEGKIMDANDQFAQIHGYKNREEVIGKRFEDFVVPGEEKKIYSYIKKKNPRYPLVLNSRRKDGKLITIESKGKDLNYKGKTIRVSVIHDISQRKEYEDKLEESRRNFQKLVELSPDGIIIQIDGETQYANTKALSIMGYKSKEELQKINIYDTLLPEYRRQAGERVKKLEMGKDLPFVEVKIKQPGGKVIELETKPIAFYYQGKKAIQLVLHDISERKQLEREQLRAEIAEETNIALKREIEDRRKIEKQLSDNEQYTRRIIESSLDMICATDKKGNIVEFNKAAQETFDYSRDEIIGKNVSLLYARKDQRNIVSTEVLKGKGTFSGEIINRKKNGEEFISYLSAAVLIGENSEVEGMVGVSRDITKIKKADEALRQSEEKYRDIFENATDLIQSVDIKGEILYVNNAWIKTLEYSKKEIKNKTIFDFIHPDSLKHCQKIFANLKKGKIASNIEMSFISKTGKKIDALGDVNVKKVNGQVVSTRGIFKEITEKKRNEEIQKVYNEISEITTRAGSVYELCKNTEKALRRIISTQEFSVMLYEQDKKILDVVFYKSEKHPKPVELSRKNALGLSEHVILSGKPILLKGKEIGQFIKKHNLKKSGHSCKSWLGVPLGIGEENIGIFILRDFIDAGELAAKHKDILEIIAGPVALAIRRIRDEQKITKQAARLKAIFESTTNIIMWTLDKNGDITGFNQNFHTSISDRLGIEPTMRMNFMKMMQPFLSENALKNFLEQFNKSMRGTPQQFEGKIRDKNGATIWIETYLNPIIITGKRVEEISALAIDITEKKEAEKVLKNSLEEKEVLLKEVHHRVKNNLQVISSILNLQSSYVDDEKTIEMLHESQNRIKSMSFLHEKLYQTKNFANINFSEYVENLVQNLAHSYQVYNSKIQTTKHIEGVMLDIDKAIPCGLIINELVSNAYKYAFPDNKEGRIDIAISKKNEDTIGIEITDNGIGLPDNFKLHSTDTLGFQLVMALVEQLNGEITLPKANGTKIIITFNL